MKKIIKTRPNETVVPVDQFGTIFAVDNPVMLSSSPISTLVGWTQGMLEVLAHDAANVYVIVFTPVAASWRSKALLTSVRVTKRCLSNYPLYSSLDYNFETILTKNFGFNGCL
ncbi:hypothetical protein CR513_25067, partial [Mucuna pruriens]